MSPYSTSKFHLGVPIGVQSPSETINNFSTKERKETMEKRESKTLREIYEEKYYHDGKLSSNIIEIAEQKGYLECLQQFQRDRWIGEERTKVMFQGILIAVLEGRFKE